MRNLLKIGLILSLCIAIICSVLLIVPLSADAAAYTVQKTNQNKGVSPVSVYTPSEEDNMLKNPGFELGEETPEYWNVSWSKSQQVIMRTDASVSRSGSRSMSLETDIENPSLFGQNIEVRPGYTYVVQGYIKTENVSSTGEGARFCVSVKSQSGTALSQSLSQSLKGTNDWTFISKTFTVPEDGRTADVCLHLWGSTGKAWYDDLFVYEYDPNDTSINPTADHSPSLSPTPNQNKFSAFGVEWDPKFWVDANIDKGVNQEDWTMTLSRVQEMGVHRVRMMVLPEWYEPNNDNDDPGTINWDGFDFSTQEADCMLRYIEACNTLGIPVTLTWWCAQTSQNVDNPWLAFTAQGSWCAAPRDIDEAVENIEALLLYLFEQKKFTCITDLILMNEPNDSFINNFNTVVFSRYIEFYQKVDAMLKRIGLRDKIQLGASDDSNNFNWYTKCVDAMSSYVDKFDSHIYAWNVRDLDFAEAVQKYVAERATYSSKPFYFGEFGTEGGSDAYTAGEVDSYDRGLFLPAFAINVLKAGGSGALYWSLHDIYYEPTGPNGGMMKTGLWQFKDKNWEVRPTYHSWALMAKYTRPDSAIYNITGTPAYLDTVALLSPEGNWTILAANRSNNPQNVSIQHHGAMNSALTTYVFSQDTVSTDDALIASNGTVQCTEQQVEFSLPANSFVLLTDIGQSAGNVEEIENTLAAIQTEQTLTDEETGISVTGYFAEGTVLQVTQTVSLEEFQQLVAGVDQELNLEALYDISFLKEGTRVFPDKPVSISIPSDKEATAAYFAEDRRFISQDSRFSQNTVTLTASRSGLFGLFTGNTGSLQGGQGTVPVYKIVLGTVLGVSLLTAAGCGTALAVSAVRQKKQNRKEDEQA